MQLTRHTDYALRVLIFLALQPPGKLIVMADIERHFAIPHNHLIKIVHRLARKGYVFTLRGKGGGLRLHREPDTIRLGTVVQDMENTLELIDCETPACPLEGLCRLKGMLNEASQAFIDVLNRHTLAEVIASPKQIEVALNWVSTHRNDAPRASKGI